MRNDIERIVQNNKSTSSQIDSIGKETRQLQGNIDKATDKKTFTSL